MQSITFSVLGLRGRHRKKAERMTVGDKVLYYVLERRVFPATAVVTSSYFEDRHPLWTNWERRDDPFPYRVHTEPAIVLNPWEGLDAGAIAPRLLYLKRWSPEQWFLGLQSEIHLLSAQDFQTVEHEMVRVVETRATRRERPPLHAPPLAQTPVGAPRQHRPGDSRRVAPAEALIRA